MVNKQQEIRNIVEEYLSPNNADFTPLILNGDVSKIISYIPRESIDLVVTSPPYWQMRDYKVAKQIGREETYAKYINKLVHISKKINFVLKDSGSYFLNIGDKYNSKKKQLLMIPSRLVIRLQEAGWVLRNFIVWYKPDHMPSGFTDRFTNTWEPVFFLVKDTGNYLTPEYYFDLDEVREKHKTDEPDVPDELPRTVSEQDYRKLLPKLEQYKKNYEGKFKGEEINKGASPGARASLFGYTYSKQRIFKPTSHDEIEIINYLRDYRKRAHLTPSKIDEILGYKHTAGHWFRTDRGGRTLPNPEDWLKLKKILKFDDKYDEKMTKIHYVLQAVMKHPLGKNPGDMWAINTDKISEAHFAIFPELLVERIVRAACPPMGIILDPFAGSGTTGKVAMELGRKSIMIEINKEYVDIMEKRFKSNVRKLI